MKTIVHESRSATRHVLRGEIVFRDGFRLTFLEYIVVENDGLRRISYRFNYVDKDGNLVFRYDNAPHHREVPTFPHHKHLGDGRVAPSEEQSLPRILEEVAELLRARKV